MGGFEGGAACDVDFGVLLVEKFGEFEAYTCVAACDDEDLRHLVWWLDQMGGDATLPERSGHSFSVKVGAGGRIWVRICPIMMSSSELRWKWA